jgi:uncharacterized membrane protein YphA (DoxX/SURF4 family)
MGACVALGCTVLLQPILFDAVFNFNLISLSVAQLGALAFFFAEAYALHHASQTDSGIDAPSSPPSAWLRLFARFALTSDLTIAFGKRLVEEMSSLFVRWQSFDDELAQHHAYVKEVEQHALEHALQRDLREPDENLTQNLHAMLAEEAPSQVSILSDAHTAFAALLMLTGGLMVWLGFRTRPSAALVAAGALVDACYRFPFLSDELASSYEWNRFHFFQALTPVGGLAIIAACGPGDLSLDARNKKAA